MNEAIKLAIEKGGYVDPSYGHEPNTVLLDPLFWQALGKASGWKGLDEIDYYQYWLEGEYSCDYQTNEVTETEIAKAGSWEEYRPIRQNNWLYHANQCFNWIMEGKDTDEFFKELLTK